MSGTYSFLDVNASLVGPGGMISLGQGAGSAEEGISYAPSREFSSMKIGADGSGMHSLLADKSGKITVRLLKTSPVNAQLSAMQAFQRSTSSAHGQNTIVISNSNMGDIVTATQCAFTKVPDLTYATEGQIVEWQFDAVRVEPVLGAG